VQEADGGMDVVDPHPQVVERRYVDLWGRPGARRERGVACSVLRDVGW